MSTHIPANAAFEEFLSGCTTVREQPGGSYVPLSDRPKFLRDGSEAPQLYLAYPDGPLQLESVITKVSHAIVQSGCSASRSLALATLALITETRPAELGAVVHANRCLASTHTCRMMQSVVIPASPPSTYELRFSTYALRRFNPEKLLYWANRCKAAYPIDIRELRGWVALEREVAEVSLIDWQRKIPMQPLIAKWGANIAQDLLVDGYYSEVAQTYADQVKENLKRDVLVLESGAMLWLDLDSLLGNPFTKLITLLQWMTDSGPAGWALYSSQIGLHINLTPAETVKANREWLLSELGFSGLTDSNKLHRLVATYCRFLQTAHGHRIDGRRDESFLHFAIALDLLVGSEGRSSDSVSQRAAVLTHRQLGTSLDEETQCLKRLYGIRSKLVHEGRSVRAEDLYELEHVCTEVLWAVLATSAKTEIDSVEKWIQKIEYLNAALRAGVTLAESEFQMVGIPEPGHSRKPPVRVNENRSPVIL